MYSNVYPAMYYNPTLPAPTCLFYLLAKRREFEDNRRRMEYIVPLGILVAFLAWVLATFSRLYHLHRVVVMAWAKWSEATQYRNDCLADFTAVFSGYLPTGDVRPRNLRRMADDSRRALDAHRELPAESDVKQLSSAERSLRQLVVNAVQAMENSELMRDDMQLSELCSRVSLSLFRQDELTRSYNRCVGNFNLALAAPGARLVAGMFGFCPLEEFR